MIIVRFTIKTGRLPPTKEVKRIYLSEEFDRAHEFIYETFDRFEEVEKVRLEETRTGINLTFRRV